MIKIEQSYDSYVVYILVYMYDYIIYIIIRTDTAIITIVSLLALAQPLPHAILISLSHTISFIIAEHLVCNVIAANSAVEGRVWVAFVELYPGTGQAVACDFAVVICKCQAI